MRSEENVESSSIVSDDIYLWIIIKRIYVCACIYIYIYIYVCVCVFLIIQ